MKLSIGFDLPEGMAREETWTWFHPNGQEALGLLIISEAPVAYTGHYARGRMRPCVGECCPLCEKNIGKQARYVFSAVRIRDGKVGILELGRPAALVVRDLAQARGRIKGLAIELFRTSESKHSRIEVKAFEGIVPKPFLNFQPLDVSRVLEVTWSTAR